MPKIRRNQKCPCNSGKKYKKCCMDKDKQHSSIEEIPRDELHEIRVAGLMNQKIYDRVKQNG